MTKITLLAHNIRSTYNVGSIFRSSDGFGIEEIILSGYTPYPKQTNDKRLPHISRKISDQIHKTALGAEETVKNHYCSDAKTVISKYRQLGYRIVALEQAKNSLELHHYRAPDKCLLMLGEELNGIEADLLALVDDVVEIKMCGQKESFNVAVATGIALYHLTQINQAN